MKRGTPHLNIANLLKYWRTRSVKDSWWSYGIPACAAPDQRLQSRHMCRFCNDTHSLWRSTSSACLVEATANMDRSRWWFEPFGHIVSPTMLWETRLSTLQVNFPHHISTNTTWGRLMKQSMICLVLRHKGFFCLRVLQSTPGPKLAMNVPGSGLIILLESIE